MRKIFFFFVGDLPPPAFNAFQETNSACRIGWDCSYISVNLFDTNGGVALGVAFR